MTTLKLIRYGIGVWIQCLCAIFLIQLIMYTAEFAEIGQEKLKELGRDCTKQVDVQKRN